MRATEITTAGPLPSFAGGAGKRNGNAGYDLAALHARDPAALDGLVRREGDFLYRFACRLVREGEEARSLVQETFLYALLGIERFRGGSRVSTWLCAIAVNRARVFRRDAGRRHARVQRDEERVRRAAGPAAWQPEAVAERRERAALVRAAVAALPEPFRMVVTLRDLEQCSTAETARILGLSEVNVRVRLHRGRTLLRERLAPRLAAG